MFAVLWFQDLEFFIWWSEIKPFPAVGINHKYMGISWNSCSLEMKRYPSDLRKHCVKDEEKKKLTVTFKTSQNSISCHKIIIKNQTKKPNTFLPSCPFHYFLCFSLSSFVLLSLLLFNLKCITSGFYKTGREPMS